MDHQEQSQVAKQLIASLEAMGSAIQKSTTHNQSIAETAGWPGAGLDRSDLSDYCEAIADRVRQATQHGIPDSYIDVLTNFSKRLEILRNNSVPQLWNGNGAQASGAILLTLLAMDQLLALALPDWPVSRDLYSLPPQLAKRIKAAELRLQEIDKSSGNVEEMLAKIVAAHDAADSFPVDLEFLKEAHAKISNMARDGELASERVNSTVKESESLFKEMLKLRDEATVIIQKCNDTFRIATSTGLAWAFDERAKNLQRTVLLWAAVLLGALGAGVHFGGKRVEALSVLVGQGSNLDWGAIALQLVLSIASVGAPIWLAWVATKQMGQRFRLAEDYAFKASVAKAYEGYRKEALALDNPEFAGRLFGVALERLEEAPLRLVAGEPMHATPFQEVISSRAFQGAVARSATLREQLGAILAAAAPTKKGASSTQQSSSTNDAS